MSTRSIGREAAGGHRMFPGVVCVRQIEGVGERGGNPLTAERTSAGGPSSTSADR
ncbi:hypothetical protein [Streptomyces sp. MMG1533]|uniref:hypothetical protein n=1 Tax=Streptomyces sp. MMG1533 TaxID=1415546 RepID=UPI000B000C9B|nr:hypothetical protein [Streptomyces sp. MMG1533]